MKITTAKMEQPALTGVDSISVFVLQASQVSLFTTCTVTAVHTGEREKCFI